jgi:PEP-CTERM motif-containing protein
MNSLKLPAALLFLVAAILLMPTCAMAGITFQASDTLGVNVFQQTQNNPCVIGDESCKEPSGFFYDNNSGTPGGGNGSTYDLFSTVYKAVNPFTAPGSYSGNQIPTSFTIGVDENIAAGAGAEVLQFFKTYVCSGPVSTANDPGQTTNPGTGCTLDTNNSYTTPTTIPNEHNGNGFSDFILTGFSLHPNSFYVFEASVSNDTDGMEEFFIIPAGTPAFVPEPASLFLVGTGLTGLAAWMRRKRSTSV